jgi:DNA-binding CsgD family transcriptional regulator
MGGAEPLERAAELEQLTALLAAAADGRGQVCVIQGASGIGKSRLLEECAGLARLSGMAVMRARCSELASDYTFGVVRNLFEANVVRAEASARAELMRGPAALAEPVFGNGEAADEFSILHGLYWLTVNLAEQQPMAILIDDLPWADEWSLRFLAYLAERLDDVPVALIVTVRSGDPGAESPQVSRLLELGTSPAIRLAALTEDGVEALLRDALPGHAVSASLAQTVLGQTGGNPFLVTAVADAIRAGDDPGLTTPESVRRRIARRLARVGQAARALANAGSVLGDGTGLCDVVQLAGLEPDRGLAAAEELVRGEFLASADPITFAHRIVRTAVYSLLTPTERVAMHAGSATLLSANGADPEVVAEHLLLSGPPHQGWVVAALHDAGRSAARKGVPSNALRYLRRAAHIADPDALPPRLSVDLGLAEAAAGEPVSLHHFERALDRLGDATERAEALYSLGQTLYRFARHDEAAAAFHRGAELFDSADRQVRLRFAGAAWAAESHRAPAQGGPEGVFEGDGPGTRAVLAVQALQQSLIAPPADRAAALAIRALGNGALLAEQSSQGPGVNLAVLALLQCGRVIEAQEAADAIVCDAREHGAQLAYAEASLIRALVNYARGRVNDAAADAQAALDVLGRSGSSHAQSALATLVNCMIERGELTEAESILGDAQDLLGQTPAINAYVLMVRGRLHLQRNDIDAARAALDATESIVGDFGDTNPTMLPWRSLAGVIAHRCGDTVRGQSLIDKEVELAQLFEVPIPFGVALRRRALTETGEQALGTLREAITVLQGTEASLELARAHASLGRVLRRAGQRVEARAQLGIGMDLANRCGATGVEADIREELTAAGGRPRRSALTGLESLTPTELRVAKLAAQGTSNSVIAEHTFVARTTVAWHLRNIYRKLAIDSREQLALLIDDWIRRADGG